MSLGRESTVAPLREAILAVSAGYIEDFRALIWGEHGEETPASIRRLETPQEKGILTRHFARQQAAEARGDAPGDTASTVMQHPAMQRAVGEQVAVEEGGGDDPLA